MGGESVVEEAGHGVWRRGGCLAGGRGRCVSGVKEGRRGGRGEEERRNRRRKRGQLSGRSGKK